MEKFKEENRKVSCMLNSNKVTNAITASGTVSASAYYSGQCNYYIFGKFCYILGEFTYTANYTPQDTQPIFRGLPIPVQYCHITAIQFLGKADARQDRSHLECELMKRGQYEIGIVVYRLLLTILRSFRRFIQLNNLLQTFFQTINFILLILTQLN